MKIEILFIFFCLSSVRFSGTNSVEIDKILPSAGETSMLSFFGVTRSGSLKKYTHQIVRITPIHPRKFEMVEKIIVQKINSIIKYRKRTMKCLGSNY